MKSNSRSSIGFEVKRFYYFTVIEILVRMVDFFLC